MTRSFKNLATFALSFLITVAALLCLCGCSSTPRTVYETIEVFKPVAIAPAPLVVPNLNEKETLSADESDWLNYLRVMVRDLLNAWAHIELVHDRIEAYNAAAVETAGSPVTRNQ